MVYIIGSLYIVEDSSTYTPEMEIIQVYAGLVVLLKKNCSTSAAYVPTEISRPDGSSVGAEEILSTTLST